MPAKRKITRFISLDFTNFFKKNICCLIATSPKNGISAAWFASLLFVIVSFFVACVAASRKLLQFRPIPDNNLMLNIEGMNGGVNKAVAFAAVWTVLILVSVSIGGTLIMRKASKKFSYFLPFRTLTLPFCFIVSNASSNRVFSRCYCNLK